MKKKFDGVADLEATATIDDVVAVSQPGRQVFAVYSLLGSSITVRVESACKDSGLEYPGKSPRWVAELSVQPYLDGNPESCDEEVVVVHSGQRCSIPRAHKLTVSAEYQPARGGMVEAFGTTELKTHCR